MFGIGKRKQAPVDEDPVIDNNKIEMYLDAFMANNKIDPKKVIVHNIESKFKNGGFLITIKAAFPGYLVGEKGERSAQIARGLSKFLNCKLNLKITD